MDNVPVTPANPRRSRSLGLVIFLAVLAAAIAGYFVYLDHVGQTVRQRALLSTQGQRI